MSFAANLQRSFFKKELTDKLIYWQSSQSKNDLYPNLPFKPVLGIQRVSNGFFYLSNNLIYFSNIPQGQIVKIKRTSDPIHWQLYSDLYKISVDQKKFRMDVPLYSEFINDHHGNRWEYSELKSPRDQFGINYTNEFYQVQSNDLTSSMLDPDWKPDDQTEESSEKLRTDLLNDVHLYIDQVTEILTSALNISREKNKGLIPSKLGSLSTFYTDGDGVFWSDFDHEDWDHHKHQVTERLIEEFSVGLEIVEKHDRINKEEKEDFLKNARSKWKTL
jgi:DNA-directed RNA polymerase subunit H (RpoH/RPB5)